MRNRVLTPKLPSANGTTFVELRTVPRGTIAATATSRSRPGPDGADTVVTVTVTNASAKAAAFFLRADVRRGTTGGAELPGDNQVISAR